MRRAGRLAAAWAAGFLVLAPLARAQVFLSPGLEGGAGYLSNRYAEPGADGSGFWRAAPGLELAAFGPDGLEGWISVRYEHTGFTRPGFSYRRRVSGWGGAAWRGRQAEVSGGVGAGLYEDGAVPADDLRWFRIESSAARDLEGGWQVSLAFALETDRYASRRTLEGDLQRDDLWEIRPGVRFRFSERVSAWAELRLDGLRSNEPTEEWSGSGISAGMEGKWGPLRAGWDAGVRWLRYRTGPAPGSGGRTDTPVWAEGWAAFRIAPALELTASAGWTGVRSTDPAEDYDTWRVEAGLRVVYDLPLN